MSTEKEFSVWTFFPDGSYIAELRWVGAEAAVKKATEMTKRPAAKIGMIARVIVTDGGDNIAFEWTYGKGVTFPTAAGAGP